MRKLIASTWITLDGIFDANSMGQWFNPYDSEERQNYIRDGILAADAFLFGRTTYEMLFPYWSSLKNNEMGVAAKLNSAPKHIVSTTLKKTEWNNASIISDNIEAEIKKLKQQPGNEIQIEGSGELVRSLMKAGLIDEYRLLVHPVVMGSGKRFFEENTSFTSLELTETKQIGKGVILLCYVPGKK